MSRIEGIPCPSDWAECEHQWKAYESMLDGSSRVAVHCVKCRCPGERLIATGEVDWPTT